MALFIIGSGILWAEFNRPSKGHSDYGNYTFNDWIGNFGKGAIMGGGMVLPLTLAPPTFFGGILATGRTILPTITGSFSLGPFQYNPGYDQFGFGIGPVSYSSGTGWDYIFDGDNTFWENISYGIRTIQSVFSAVQLGTDIKKGIEVSKTMGQSDFTLVSDRYGDYRLVPAGKGNVNNFSDDQIILKLEEGSNYLQLNSNKGFKGDLDGIYLPNIGTGTIIKLNGPNSRMNFYIFNTQVRYSTLRMSFNILLNQIRGLDTFYPFHSPPSGWKTFNELIDYFNTYGI